MTRREETEGEREDEKLPGRILRVIRAARDVRQEVVARGLGKAGSSLSELENGSIARRDLMKAVRVMKLSPETIEWTQDYLSRLDRSAQFCAAPGNGEDEEQREHRRMVAELGQWIEEMSLEGLKRRDRLMKAAEEKRKAQILVEWLRWHSQASRLALVQESAEYHFWRFVRQVCDESLKATADDADLAREWAEVAVLAARHVPGDEGRKARTQGAAKVHLANALRVKGELKAADRAYGDGCHLLAQGGKGDPEEINEARVLGFGASLRRDQRRFGEALDLLAQALEVDKGELTPHLLINKANLLRVMGELEGAVAALQDVEPYLDAVDDPRLALATRLNLVDYLSVLEIYDAASQRLPEVWRLADDAAGELDRIRLVWIQGRVAAETDQEDEGIKALEQVRQAFGARQMAYDSALATLELAALYLRLGRSEDVKSLAREMATIFESQEVHREALGALSLFRQAVEQERATLDLVERLARYLHRARYNPELRYEG